MKFMLFDSHIRKKVEFEPEFANLARIYLCGPTVYDDAHLGHARSAISFDLLRRTLTALGFEVKFARNITDIDDKILKKMRESGESLPKITQFFTSRYHADMGSLGVELPNIEPKATDHIEEMIGLISHLIKADQAYVAPNGDVYFDTSKDSSYGALSGETQEETVSRVEADQKKNARDFVLWKIESDQTQVAFDSPFGRGRPGWHIECSAMVQKHLYKEGAKFSCDIHAGGMDLFFPHHENEAAQTRCGYGNEIAKYWMHNGFVRIDGEKMSKSLGNSFFVKDALLHYPAELLRFYLMSIHYRSGLNYNDQDIEASKKRLDKIYRLKKRLVGSSATADEEFASELISSLADDLNISEALATVDQMINSTNEKLDKNPKDKDSKSKAVANLELVSKVLGIGKNDPFQWFQYGVSDQEKAKIEELISQRGEAKKAKDFAKADRIRDELTAMKIAIMDTAEKTVWEKLS